MCVTHEGNRIKIIDFGLARKYDPDKKLQVSYLLLKSILYFTFGWPFMGKIWESVYPNYVCYSDCYL